VPKGCVSVSERPVGVANRSRDGGSSRRSDGPSAPGARVRRELPLGRDAGQLAQAGAKLAIGERRCRAVLHGTVPAVSRVVGAELGREPPMHRPGPEHDDPIAGRHQGGDAAQVGGQEALTPPVGEVVRVGTTPRAHPRIVVGLAGRAPMRRDLRPDPAGLGLAAGGGRAAAPQQDRLVGVEPDESDGPMLVLALEPHRIASGRHAAGRAARAAAIVSRSTGSGQESTVTNGPLDGMDGAIRPIRGAAAAGQSIRMAASVEPGARVPAAGAGGTHAARRIVVEGVVQGVGFRPFVWRLATELGLAGRVRNAAGRVEIEAAGEPASLAAFARRLRSDAPPRARVERVATTPLEATLGDALPSPFAIDESVGATATERLFPPDIATCDDCIREVGDPADRRAGYPFTNCTNCGPRATIIDQLPYDRAQTTMRAFPLCPACAAEYADPANRRFHAEPVACATCGPRLAYRPTDAAAPTTWAGAALAAAVAEIRAGRIVAIKGLGGYHLACDATDDGAVRRLRDRKRRWAKPFAVMVEDVTAAGRLARIGAAEQALLLGPARPIVLLEAHRRGEPALAPSVAAGNRRLGIFLPYTPLHHLLMAAVGRPIVLTSGNLADEPLATDDADAAERLAGLADAFLVHDREIRARYDDSVTRVVAGHESIVRRARGYAPEALPLPVPAGRPLLAVGAELKHTFTLARGSRAHVAPHNGDLEDLATHRAFTDGLAHLGRLLALEPEVAAHDLHPEYLSTKYAVARFPAERRIAVQHHHAHVASCAAEHGISGPFIGVAYDGLGMGDDGTLWGGEILAADLAGYRRLGRFGRAPLPGGALAVRRPYRMALGYLLAAEAIDDDGDAMSPDPALLAAITARLDPREVAVIRTQLARRLNAPLASSAGRLFDAAAAIIGLRDVAEYEAQAAIDLEIAAGERRAAALPARLARVDGLLVYDPRPTLRALVEGAAAGRSPGILAAAFHETIADVTRELVDGARAATGLRTVCLSGGVFQNRRLASTLVRRLGRDGFDVFINRRVPVNDGGISYGQAAVAAATMAADAGRGPAVPAGRA